MTGSVLKFEAVMKRFRRAEALCNCSFNVTHGEIVGLVGPNGCGKTTTVRLAVGFICPTAGEVRVFGRSPDRELRRVGKRPGVMFDRPGVCDDLTVREYLSFHAALLGVRGSEREQCVLDAIGHVGLSQRVDDCGRTLSKGMKQRVSLARCLVGQPELLILDEPFDGTDVESRAAITELLANLSRNRKVSVLATSHNLSEIERVCDRVVIMKEGRILAADSPEGLRRRCTRRRGYIVRLASTNGMDIAGLFPGSSYDPVHSELFVDASTCSVDGKDILEAMLAHGVTVLAFNEAESSFLDAYFSITGGNQQC